MSLAGCFSGRRGASQTDVHAPSSAALADYDWALRSLAGEPTSLEAYRGRVIFLNVWASWCRPCVSELADIATLQDNLADSDVAFLLVSPEDREPVERFMKRYRIGLPVLLELEPMPQAFGLRALPTTYIIDRTGRIVLMHRGARNWNHVQIRGLLRQLIEEQP